jgi:hypothetical protein
MQLRSQETLFEQNILQNQNQDEDKSIKQIFYFES